ASYVLDRADRAIDRDRGAFLAEYGRGGRDELISAINKETELRPSRGIYLLTDAAYAPLAGNRNQWPSALAGQAVRANYDATESASAEDRALIRDAYSA